MQKKDKSLTLSETCRHAQKDLGRLQLEVIELRKQLTKHVEEPTRMTSSLRENIKQDVES